jgi:hypothetical protein
VDPGGACFIPSPPHDLRYTPSSHSPSSRTPSHGNQPPVINPLPRMAGPSHVGGYRTPGDAALHPSPLSLDQDNLLDPPSWHAAPTLIGSSYQKHSPGLRSPVMGSVGPSRAPAVYPTTRHQPYPQSRPQQEELHLSPSPVRGQAKGEGRRTPLTTMNHGLQTPNTPSRGNCLEVCPNVLRYCTSSDTVR